MALSPLALVGVGLVLAGWTVGAAWLWLQALLKVRRAQQALAHLRRLARMVEDCPAVPLLVRSDGRIEGPGRLAAWLGLESLPEFLADLAAGEHGLAPADLQTLESAIRRTQKTAAPFSLVLQPLGSGRSLVVRGALAHALVAPGGAALLWWFDSSDSQRELQTLRAQASQAQADFAAVIGLIEAAPLPMWFRGADLQLQLVNAAYVAAVGAEDPAAVIAGQTELIESVDGVSAGQHARQALEQGRPVERIVQATVGSARRTLRVSDLPIGADAVAGYAVDIEDFEEQRRALRAFREAQRSMLDKLSVGVAQFDPEQRLSFANQPFRRIFALPPSILADPPDFGRFLDLARDQARLPEMRDFPQWREELRRWFQASNPVENNWTLSDNTHVRIVAQPMPDGGLVLVAEDRSEQLALSAVRDTLLRTRTATFDSLFEALAVFAPNGRIELWNRLFPSIWGLPERALDQHPHIDQVLDQIGTRLARPGQRAAIDEVVRAATLDRRKRGGQVKLADGRTLEFGGVPLPDGNSLLTVLDVTDSTKAEAALRERNAALEDADALKTRFLANMSYEFRTPLTSIGGFAELLHNGVAGELTETGREYVAAILASVERLSQQIESVLDLTQSEAGLLPLANEAIDLFPFLTRLVREREAAIEAAGISLDLRRDKGSSTIRGDTRQLGRAIGNVLDNAIAATGRDGRVLVLLTRRGAEAAIVVSDNGAGLDPAEMAHALEGYRIAAAGRPAPEAGQRGLGLPLARQLIEAHRGRLELQSEKGVGTSVTILLP